MIKLRSWWLPLLLLTVFWGSRATSLEILPLHNDEGLHLTRAVEVWNLHPFWQISDGKIINHWPIALFYPQHAPVFAGRIPTIMVSMIGLAAGYALSRRLFGTIPALLASAMWITSPYLFFFERLAFSDSEAGALVIITLWASLWAARSGLSRDAVLTGLALGLAMLFKFTAAPFTLMVAVVLLFASQLSWRKRVWQLVIVGVTVAACFAVPLLYLAVRGDDFFMIALGWIGTGSRSSPAFATNMTRLWEQLTGFGSVIWMWLMLGGLVLLPVAPFFLAKGEAPLRPYRNTLLTRTSGIILLAAGAIPFLLMLILGREVLARHYVVVLPLALVYAGIGLGLLVNLLGSERAQAIAATAITIVVALSVTPFMLQAYTDPGHLPLPDAVSTQHVTEHSAGFGLREAMLSFPEVIKQPDLPIIGSMSPDGCKRANFYAVEGLALTCVAAPGLPEIEGALAEYGAVYVLTDEAPTLGIDVNTLSGVKITRLGSYPRPDETEDAASVVLWLLEK